MKISKVGIELIKGFEGFRDKAYKCVSTEKYYTIGYGHNGVDVIKDSVITVEEATELLKNDLLVFEEKVNKYYDIYKWNQNEFDALVSFAYNIGNIDQLTQKGTRTKDKIASCILLYNKSGGKVLSGLVTRRKKEQELFLTPINNDNCYSSTIKYYNKYTGCSNQIDIIFKAIGVEEEYIGNYIRRKPIAEINGYSNYTGKANENLSLIKLAKEGKLLRV